MEGVLHGIPQVLGPLLFLQYVACCCLAEPADPEEGRVLVAPVSDSRTSSAPRASLNYCAGSPEASFCSPRVAGSQTSLNETQPPFCTPSPILGAHLVRFGNSGRLGQCSKPALPVFTAPGPTNFIQALSDIALGQFWIRVLQLGSKESGVWSSSVPHCKAPRSKEGCMALCDRCLGQNLGGAGVCQVVHDPVHGINPRFLSLGSLSLLQLPHNLQTSFPSVPIAA